MRRHSVFVFSTTLFATLVLWGIALPTTGWTQDPEPLYDEAKVPNYTLPPLLKTTDGDSVQTAETWWKERRPQLLTLFRDHMYGELPPSPPTFRIDEHSSDPSVFDGTATRRQVTLHFTNRPDGPQMDVLVYRPNDVNGPVPVFVGLNFAGNHTVSPDTAVRAPDGWIPRWGNDETPRDSLITLMRGRMQKSWPVDSLVAHGYGLITAHYGDLFPDHEDGATNSVYQLRPDSTAPDTAVTNGGALSAWAWGLHRMLEFARQSDALDGERVIAVGHSRLSKTALWAGATNRGFAAVIDNASGAGGSALFRRRYGERVEHLAGGFPHWFSPSFDQYRGRESALPVDQHQLLATIAPRPLLVSPKTKDRWADPRGMFLAAKHASPVWHLLGQEGLAVDSMPAPDTPVLSRVGVFYRTGEHSLTPTDWSVFLDFADRHLPPPSEKSD